jgi:hypothetical protein
MSSNKECLFPDISDILEKPDVLGDILEEKVEIRLRLGKPSFQEKVEAIEALREWLKPFKDARERRKAPTGLRPEIGHH